MRSVPIEFARPGPSQRQLPYRCPAALATPLRVSQPARAVVLLSLSKQFSLHGTTLPNELRRPNRLIMSVGTLAAQASCEFVTIECGNETRWDACGPGVL